MIKFVLNNAVPNQTNLSLLSSYKISSVIDSIRLYLYFPAARLLHSGKLFSSVINVVFIKDHCLLCYILL